RLLRREREAVIERRQERVVPAERAHFAEQGAEEEVLLSRIGVVDLVLVGVSLERGVVLGEELLDDRVILARIGNERHARAAGLRHYPAEERCALAEESRRLGARARRRLRELAPLEVGLGVQRPVAIGIFGKQETVGQLFGIDGALGNLGLLGQLAERRLA